MANLHPFVVHMRELRGSPSWEMLVKAVDQLATEEIERMLSGDGSQFDYHKGKIEAYRMLEKLPDALIQRYTNAS